MLMRDLLLSCRQPSLAQPQGVPLLAACTYTSRLQAMAHFRFHRIEGSRTGWTCAGGPSCISCKEFKRCVRAVLLLSRLHLPLEYIQDEQHAHGLLSSVPPLGTICTCKA